MIVWGQVVRLPALQVTIPGADEPMDVDLHAGTPLLLGDTVALVQVTAGQWAALGVVATSVDTGGDLGGLDPLSVTFAVLRFVPPGSISYNGETLEITSPDSTARIRGGDGVTRTTVAIRVEADSSITILELGVSLP